MREELSGLDLGMGGGRGEGEGMETILAVPACFRELVLLLLLVVVVVNY